jgi:hypothetical protein
MRVYIFQNTSSGDKLIYYLRCGVLTKLGMGSNTVLVSMYRSHTKKAETCRRNGCASEEQEENGDGEVGHDAVFIIWFGGKSCSDCLKVNFVRLLILLRTGIHFHRWDS